MRKSPIYITFTIFFYPFSATVLGMEPESNIIHDAAYHNNLPLFKELLTESLVDVLDERMRTPLSCALSGNACDVLEYLFTLQPSVNIPDVSGTTPLFIATTHNDCITMKQLLERCANPHHANQDQWTATAQAVYGNKLDAIKILLAQALTFPLKDFDYNQLSLEKQCGIFYVKHWQDLEKKQRLEVVSLDFFPNLLLDIQLRCMKRMLLQNTKQRGNCLKIAHDENHINLEAYLQSIVSAQTLMDINDVKLHQLVVQAIEKRFGVKFK